MQRELSNKATANLLKTTFARKGASITHTEALDLVAKMKGYEAWSHLQAAAPKAPEPQQERTMPIVLRQHFGDDGEAPFYTRQAYLREYNDRGNDHYWDCVALEVGTTAGDFYIPKGLVFHPAKAHKVTLSSGASGVWNIECDLTDRWGEFNSYAPEEKSGLVILAADPGLYERCRAQMWDECTFLARKDGRFGVLYEVEYASKESEEFLVKPEDNNFPPHDQAVANLVATIKQLEPKFPNVEFCVPPQEAIIEERPAIWAFVPMSHPLTSGQRRSLGLAVLGATE